MNRPIMEAWKNKINVVDAVRGGISSDAKQTLARVLENTNRSLKDLKAIKNESAVSGVPASQMSGIDWFPEHAIDMVSTIYASQIADDLVSVQSIDSPVGIIRFIQYVYGDRRGAAAKGDIAIDEWGAMRGAHAGNFVASERVTDEAAGSADGTKLECFLQQLPVKVDATTYIDFVKLDDHTRLRCRKESNGWKVVGVDSNGYENSSLPGNYHFALEEESGKAILSADTLNGEFSVSYFQDLSTVPTDSMNLDIRVKTEVIKAVPHKIRANFAFDASYALSKAHGINIEESLVNACTAEIRQERDNEIINILMKQAGSKSTWDRQVTSYISQHDHDLSFINEIFACSSRINYETKRGFGNWVVVGRQGLNIIKSAGTDHFTPAGATLPNNGAFVAGEIEGQIKVIYSPYVPEDVYLVGYKGSDMDAGFVVADFLPITKTDLVMLDDFVGRQGLVSYYGTKMINNKMYVAGKIINGDLRR